MLMIINLYSALNPQPELVLGKQASAMNSLSGC